MALTGTNRGAGSSDTGGESTYVISPASNCTSGAMLVLCVAYDNSDTSGTDPYNSISDSNSGVWTSRLNVTNDPGAANAGVSLRVFTTLQSGGALTTSDTITITYDEVTVARAYTLTEVTGSTGTPTYVTGATETATTSTPTITSSSIPVGNLILACVGREGNNVAAVTGDSDTDNGSWSTQQESGVGLGVAGCEIISQFKVTSVFDGTQTYNPTYGGTSRDGCEAWIEIEEVAAAHHTASFPTPKAIAVDKFAPSAATTEKNFSALTLKAVAVASYAPSATTTEKHFSALPLKAIAVAANAPGAIVSDPNTTSLTVKAISVDKYALNATVTENNYSSLTTKAVAVASFAPQASTTEHNFSALPLKAIAIAAYAPGATTTTADGHTSSLTVKAVAIASNAPQATTTEHNQCALPLKAVSVSSLAPGAYITEKHFSSLPLKALAVTAIAPTATTSDINTSSLPLKAISLVAYAPSAITGEGHFCSLPTKGLVIQAYAMSSPTSVVYASVTLRATSVDTSLESINIAALSSREDVALSARAQRFKLKAKQRSWTL